MIVRPHPNANAPWDGVELGDPRAVIWPRVGIHPVAAQARADFYDSLAHAAAVVGINTTAMIEAAILEQSVLPLLVPSFAQEATLHFRNLLAENGGFLHVATGLDEHLLQLRGVLERTRRAPGGGGASSSPSSARSASTGRRRRLRPRQSSSSVLSSRSARPGPASCPGPEHALRPHSRRGTPAGARPRMRLAKQRRRSRRRRAAGGRTSSSWRSTRRSCASGSTTRCPSASRWCSSPRSSAPAARCSASSSTATRSATPTRTS